MISSPTYTPDPGDIIFAKKEGEWPDSSSLVGSEELVQLVIGQRAEPPNHTDAYEAYLDGTICEVHIDLITDAISLADELSIMRMDNVHSLEEGIAMLKKQEQEIEEQ